MLVPTGLQPKKPMRFGTRKGHRDLGTKRWKICRKKTKRIEENGSRRIKSNQTREGKTKACEEKDSNHRRDVPDVARQGASRAPATRSRRGWGGGGGSRSTRRRLRLEFGGGERGKAQALGFSGGERGRQGGGGRENQRRDEGEKEMREGGW